MSFVDTEAPKFHHPEIAGLYQQGLRIEAAELQTILNLPRETLVQDLELILTDTKQRYDYYKNIVEEELEEELLDAPLHAIMLLGEVQSKASLPAILDWLSQPGDVVDFWLGDHMTETIWEAVYKLLPDDWELLEAFLKKPEVNMFAKGAVTQALNELTVMQPEHRATVISLYERMLTHYQLHPAVAEQDEFVSTLVSDAFEIQARELIPIITILHDMIQLDTMMAGWKKDIVSDMEREPYMKREVLPLTERYQEIVTTWAGYTEKDEEEEPDMDEVEEPDEETDDWEPVERPAVQEFVPVRTEPKIGRNDPCPCGSGKKYKKCCMNNG